MTLLETGESRESGEPMRRRTAMWIFLALALASLSALAAGQDSTQAKDPAPASQAGPTYVIGPDDTLYISVWKEPDLTETLPVRADGKISMPLLNDVQAAGLTPMQLGAALTDKLKKYVSDPHVTIVVTQMNSQRVYVTGEVLHPGPMNLTPNMTVLQALSAAGFTQFANTKGIYVLRNERGSETKLPVNYKKLIKGEGGQNVALKPGDTIVVP
jgi:polysaccharide export outer membrane protein